MAGMIEGKRWLDTRVSHLQAAVAAETDPDRRQAIQAELDAIQAERHQHHGGWRALWGGWRRRGDL